MANTINAITTGIGGLATTADSSGNINLQSAGSTVVAVTSGGVAVTGTLSATGNITQNGNAVLNAGSTVTVAQGGTGLTSFTSGGAMYATSTSALTTGILPVASGGTGTATPSLVGGTNITISGSWPNQTVTAAGGAPTTAQVLSATAGASVDEVGTYAWLGNTSSGTGYSPGSNYAGSGLAMAGAASLGNYPWTQSNVGSITNDSSGGGRSGTWKCMGGNGSNQSGSDRARATLFLRVS